MHLIDFASSSIKAKKKHQVQQKLNNWHQGAAASILLSHHLLGLQSIAFSLALIPSRIFGCPYPLPAGVFYGGWSPALSAWRSSIARFSTVILAHQSSMWVSDVSLPHITCTSSMGRSLNLGSMMMRQCHALLLPHEGGPTASQ
jgi:hypothetical protein